MGLDITAHRQHAHGHNPTGWMSIDLKPWKLSDKKKKRTYSTLSVLINSGLDLRSALEMLVEDQDKSPDKAFFNELKQSIVDGGSLSAFTAASRQFSNYESFSLKIGEESGRLADVLEELASYFERKIELQRMFVKVLAYPSFIIIVSIAVMWFMLSFVVPLFADVFVRFDAELPAITRFVISTSQWFGNWGLLLFIGFSCAIISLRMARRKPWLRTLKSRLLLKIPLLGSLLAQLYLARFCQSMFLLLRAQTPLVKALELTQQMVDFEPLESALGQAREDIVAGGALHSALADHKIFNTRLLWMIRVGEESGNLDDIFEKLTTQYTSETEYQSAILGALLEPALIVFIALFVGFILVSMYLPLFELGSVIG